MNESSLSPLGARLRASLPMLMLLAFACVILFHPSLALASSTGESMPWDSPLTKVLNSVTGPVAFVFSVIALVAFGCALLFGSDLNAFVRGLLVLMMIISVVVFAKNMAASVFGIGAVATSSLHGVNLVNLVIVGCTVALGAAGMALDVRAAKRRAIARNVKAG
jgi:type IV secretion system protein VirB2